MSSKNQDVELNKKEGGKNNQKKNKIKGGNKEPVTLKLPEKVSECALDIPGNICSTEPTIQAMKKHLEDKNIDTSSIKSKEDVVETIKESLQCSTERCVLQNPKFVKNEIKGIIKESLERIKPYGPSNSNKLLNNDNIDDVLRKLTKQHKGFYHMNFQMIDFAGEKDGDSWKVVKGETISPTELGTIDMTKDVINKGYKTFGVVLNTDKRTNGGIHWFSLFCDFRVSPCTIEYFNSSGNKPVRQIQEWLVKTEDSINKAGVCKATVVILSGLVHQRDSETECGPYSLYYIWNRLNGIPAMKFQEQRIPDRLMLEFRKHCFAKN